MTLQIRDPIHGDDASPLSRFLSVPFKIGQPKRLNRRLGMMKKCLKNTWFPRVGLLVFLLMFFSLTPPGICQDGNTAEQIETIESALVKDKGDYGILIDGRQYRVTESTPRASRNDTSRPAVAPPCTIPKSIPKNSRDRYGRM